MNKNFVNAEQKVILFDGRLCSMEDLKIDDVVMGPDGLKRFIVHKARNFGTVYKVIQKEGPDYLADEDQILFLRKNGTPSNDVLEDPRNNDFMETIEISIKDFLETDPGFRVDVQAYKTYIDFPLRDIGIDPYDIGKWLGGEEINEKFSMFNLLPEIKIPDNYLYTTVKNRLKLLAGIIETCGVRQLTWYRMNIYDKDFFNQIVFLANSLGFHVKIGTLSPWKRVKNRIIEKKEQPTEELLRLYITGYIKDIPTIKVGKSGRKGDVHLKKQPNPFKTKFELKNLGKKDYYKIKVNGDGRCLLEDCTVVHL